MRGCEAKKNSSTGLEHDEDEETKWRTNRDRR